MEGDDVSVVRTELNGYESDLRDLLLDYFEFADGLAQEHFDALDGIDIEEAAQSDIDRLTSATVDRPLCIAHVDDRIVGTVQLKQLDETTAEVKRLYVVPDYRGEGLGRQLMECLLDGAADDGFTTLLLGVGPYLDKAQTLYEDLGFEFTPPYEQSQAPEEIRDDWQFMRLSLSDAAPNST